MQYHILLLSLISICLVKYTAMVCGIREGMGQQIIVTKKKGTIKTKTIKQTRKNVAKEDYLCYNKQKVRISNKN